MIELTLLLKQLNATTKTKEKQALIANISNDVKKLFVLTYNPFITFGVKKIPDFTCDVNNISSIEDLEPFYELCDKLSERYLTGHAALNAIASTLSSYSQETANTLSLVLGRDLQTNLAAKNINKVYHDLIPEFTCMLADKMDHRFDWSKGPWLVEYKYDGMRILAHVMENSVEYLSREGILQEKYQGLFDVYLLALRNSIGRNIYVDGEVLAPTFSDTMKSRKSGADKSNLEFRAFDMLTEKEWNDQYTSRSNIHRREYLEVLLENLYIEKPIVQNSDDDVFGLSNNNPPMNKVIISYGKICNTKDELNAFYQDLVTNGAEGVIIKDMNALYQWKRNRAWTKYKPVYDADLKVIGRYAGNADTKYSNTLGGLNLEGYLEDGTFVVADCGSGFSDAIRDEIWAMDINKLTEMTVEVEYGDISKSDDNANYSLRFPVFKRFRYDK